MIGGYHQNAEKVKINTKNNKIAVRECQRKETRKTELHYVRKARRKSSIHVHTMNSIKSTIFAYREMYTRQFRL